MATLEVTVVVGFNPIKSRHSNSASTPYDHTVEIYSPATSCYDIGMDREMRQERLAHALGRMLQAAGDAMESAARQGKMHPTDLRCISLLQSSEAPISPKEIIKTLGLTSGSGTALFDRLERLGFTRRIPNADDRRSVLIELDHSAANGPLALLGDLRERYRQVTERFSDEELDIISDYLEAVSKLKPSAAYDQS